MEKEPQEIVALFVFILLPTRREACPDNPEYFRETSGSPGGPTKQEAAKMQLFLFCHIWARSL